ncbi:TetR/AcrR family transcriptional regulator [Chloroflexia bacterium SDU3-3]|nr:TetR/AcrR family transcriptional regulator [Chloroflexia bacterium SDU3-3]
MERPALDDRVRRSKEKVLQATSELLAEHGVSGLSVDDVARRSGVAKTTIYRHWPTRTDLVVDACFHLGTHAEVPDTGTFVGDVHALMMTIATLLTTARWSSVMPSIIDAAERSPDLAAVHSSIQRGHTLPLQTLIARAMSKGELPPDTDVDALIALLMGAVYYRRWFSREPLDAAFVASVVRSVLG